MKKLKIFLTYISSNRVWIITLACLDVFFIFLAWLANPDYFINYVALIIFVSFGILMSNVHMAWTRAVCGRLKSDYSYSNMIVYNNFPWPSPTNDQKEKIRKTAQAILNARALYTDSNLADLYDPLTMPTELLKAHKANNRAVMHAYGFSIKMSEADCVAELMRMYQKLTKEK